MPKCSQRLGKVSQTVNQSLPQRRGMNVGWCEIQILYTSAKPLIGPDPFGEKQAVLRDINKTHHKVRMNTSASWT